MELRHLRYFVAIAELESFTRASRQLYIAQPPLSIQVKQLEDEVGVALLDRYRRGVRLTAAGQIFLKEAKEILAHAERAKLAARRSDASVTPSLGIGFVPSSGYLVLPRLIKNLRAAIENLQLEVTEMSTAEQVSGIEAGHIQFGLARTPIPKGDVIIAARLDDPFCVAIPEGDSELGGGGPLDMDSLSNRIFVSYARRNSPVFFDQGIALCTDAGFSPDIRYSASSVYGVMDLVSAGLGVALVPASAVLLARSQVKIRPINEPTREASLALIQRRGESDDLLRAVSGMATLLFKELAASIQDALGLSSAPA
ncbi:LysR family transcriptional regulator [Bradyrhizobium sp. CCBAU 11361]|uniref:LysR family transcriptional regulator n=1 Tax=Bradyrhizobium sp. CCBAU 11361 TaxID=1630812 RepID=UPI002304347E|nr:LysR substrate-binding domain-containing protein [Bradyrhizobium sp. CCBAU 11361]MDA9489916.1 hypothetical protein [Bradyrhizobium sp. CCBAU 11361]